MIVTAHYEDGTTQDFECPDCATHIQYSGSSGHVFALWGDAVENYKIVGQMRVKQRKGLGIVNQKIIEE